MVKTLNISSKKLGSVVNSRSSPRHVCKLGQVSIKKRNVDKRKLQDVLEGFDEPALGLENIIEWWPSNDKVCVMPSLCH